MLFRDQEEVAAGRPNLRKVPGEEAMNGQCDGDSGVENMSSALGVVSVVGVEGFAMLDVGVLESNKHGIRQTATCREFTDPP